MYATRLQFDVLFPLKEITGNDNMRMTEARNIKDETVLKEFFKRIIQYSIQGCFVYNPYLDLKNKRGIVYNPLGFVWTWFHDIFDSENKEAVFWFKNVMEKYWVIDKWAKDLSPLNEAGKDICFVTNIDELQKYSKFDMEELYQRDTHFDDNKSVDEHLAQQDWENLLPWQVEQLAHKYGYEALAAYGKPYLDKGYAYNIDVCLLVEVINRGDYSTKELKKWIGDFFKEGVTDRGLLETCIKADIKEEHKPLVKRVYMRFFKKYMDEEVENDFR